MGLKYILVAIWSLWVGVPQLLIGDETSSWDAQAELSQIDQELEQLEDLKNRYRASAARKEDEATRWQFEQDLKQEARQAQRQAALDREMERQIQLRIDFLQARKAELLKSGQGAK